MPRMQDMHALGDMPAPSQGRATKDIAPAEGSVASSGSSVLKPSKLQFFGLLETQSESQSQYNNHDIEAFGDGGSQKENVDVDMDKEPQADEEEIREALTKDASQRSSTGTPMKRSTAAFPRVNPRSNTRQRSQSLLDTTRLHTPKSPLSPAQEDDEDLAEENPPVVYVDASDPESQKLSEAGDDDDERDYLYNFQCGQPPQELSDGEDDAVDDIDDPSQRLVTSPSRRPPTPSPSPPVFPDLDTQLTQATASTQVVDDVIQETGPSVTDPKDYDIIHKLVKLAGSDENSIKRRLGKMNIPNLDLDTFRCEDYLSATPPTSQSIAHYRAILDSQSLPASQPEAGPSMWQETQPSRNHWLDGEGEAGPSTRQEVRSSPSREVEEESFPIGEATQPARNHWMETQPSHDESISRPKRFIQPPPVVQRATQDSISEVPDSDPRSQRSNPSPPSTFFKPPLKPSVISKPRPADKSTSTEADDSADIVPDSLELEEESRRNIDKSFARRMEEEESSDDILHPKPTSKPTSATTKTKAKPTSASVKAASKPISAPKSSNVGKRKRSLSTEVVPCSLPSDMPPPKSTARRTTRNAKGKGKAPVTTRKTTRRGKQRQVTETLSGDEESDESEHVDLKREREATVLLNEAGPSNPKRRRLGSKAATPSLSGHVKREVGLTKSIRTESIVRAVENVRAWVLFASEGMYYSCTIEEVKGTKRVAIRYDDGNSGEVDIGHLRRFELFAGDAVQIEHSDTTLDSALVVDGRVTDSNEVLVDLNDEQVMVNVKSIRLSSKSVKECWGDRFLRSQDLFPNDEDPDSSDGLFAGYAFVVTWSRAAGKEESINSLEFAGAKVYDNWHNVIVWNGQFQDQDWSIERGSAKWNGSKNLRHVFLLADTANEKPKYLTALALGIPCVSVEWARASAKEGRILDWRAYLLPAGVYMERRVSQLIDLNWDTTDLVDILDNPVPMKLLRGKTVLVAGTSYMPKRQIDGTDGSHNVPLILFAMGADKVKVLKGAVTRPAAAKFDMVVYDGASTKPRCAHPNIVQWQSLKGSLIANRLVD